MQWRAADLQPLDHLDHRALAPAGHAHPVHSHDDETCHTPMCDTPPVKNKELLPDAASTQAMPAPLLSPVARGRLPPTWLYASLGGRALRRLHDRVPARRSLQGRRGRVFC